MQLLIDELVGSSPLSEEDQLKRLKRNEALITVKKINYYIKNKDRSKKIYNSLKKLLPEIIIDPKSSFPVKIKTKQFEDSFKFIKEPVIELNKSRFLINLKAKDKNGLKEVLEEMMDLWQATDCNREFCELLGFSEDEYKNWILSN